MDPLTTLMQSTGYEKGKMKIEQINEVALRRNNFSLKIVAFQEIIWELFHVYQMRMYKRKWLADA